MKFLFLNQTFHPDVVATAQYLTDLACGLVRRGHEVTVITGRRAYDSPEKSFPARELWNGIDIRRVSGTRFGKKSKIRRVADFGSFILACFWQLARAQRPDALVALTSPPLISFVAAWYARLRGCHFVYWVMDLNPDEAIAAGWLRERSLVARLLNRLSEFSFNRAKAIVVLDRFMRQRVLAKGIASEKVIVLPPWSHDEVVHFETAGREQFRREHGLSEKFVVMYSGNHSPCHPLTTVLEAAKKLADDEKFAFCFIGGGSEFAKVQQFAETNRLRNILWLPYQQLDKLAGSLSAADMHVVVMGDPFVGTIHPCKIYNILSVEAPLLYVGPEESHITDILREMNSASAIRVAHGDVDGAIRAIQATGARRDRGHAEVYRKTAARFSQSHLLPQMISALEKAGVPALVQK